MTVSVEAGPPCIQSPCILIEVGIYSEKKIPLNKPSIERFLQIYKYKRDYGKYIIMQL